jgi:hypothetical protein
LDVLLPVWTLTFNVLAGQLKAIYDEKICNAIRTFLAGNAKSAAMTCPDLSEPLRHWVESSLRTIAIIQKHSSGVFSGTIHDAVCEAHRLVAPKILESWDTVLDVSGKAAGKFPVSGWSIRYITENSPLGPGHYKRNQQLHNQHAKKISRVMYKKSSAAIKNHLKKMFEGVPQELGDGTKEALAQIQDEFEEMLSNHTLGIDGEATATVTSLTKAQLQDEVKDCYRLIKLTWAKPIEVVFDESEEAEPVDEQLSIDDLLNDDEDNDADFEILSDIE